ncbi:hypothetical protein ACIHEI_29010 [Kitasatospora sp. NPDC051984]|uniref:hypothetical protein n=1 Tax=Kitasatospora sp. NPDC051984 TaxID=3364059 RepID=UPI0037C8CAC1
MTERKLELVSAARRAVLRMDETERPRLVVLGVSGGVNWLMAAFGPFLGRWLAKGYYLVATDRSVYVLSGAASADGPSRVLHVVPLAEAGTMVTKAKLGTTWNSVRLRLPGRRRPVRVKVSFQSRSELERFLGKL